MKNTSTAISEPVHLPEPIDRRYVYNGSTTETDVRRGNRPVQTRKRSPLTIVALLFVISIGIVLYVWNKISVNRLVVEVSDLQVQFDKVHVLPSQP